MLSVVILKLSRAATAWRDIDTVIEYFTIMILRNSTGNGKGEVKAASGTGSLPVSGRKVDAEGR